MNRSVFFVIAVVALAACGSGGGSAPPVVQGVAVCGNGVAEAAEVCDGFDFRGETCQSMGDYIRGTLACSNDCGSVLTVDCVATPSGTNVCGDSVVDDGEACDTVVPADATCRNQGFDGGSLLCTTQCRWNTDGCYECGDGICHPAGETCSSCSADCGPCTTTPTCGDGVCQGETYATCCTDCGCETGFSCKSTGCAPVCGDGICAAGESRDSCCTDCSCLPGTACVGGSCVSTDPCAGIACAACEMCTGGQCVSDFAQDGSSCGSGKVCSAGSCVSACAGVTCPACMKCSGGACVADTSQDGNSCGLGMSCATGTCQSDCLGVSCSVCEKCEGGACVADSGQNGDSCASGKICSAGSCTSSCVESDYWLPTVVSDYDTASGVKLGIQVAQGVDSSTGAPGKSLWTRVCKESGTFQNAVAFLLVETDKYTDAVLVDDVVSPTSSDPSCADWSELGYTSNWSLGEGLAGWIRVVSPSSCAAKWDYGCTTAPSPGCGSCWHFSVPTMTRTCLE